MAQRAATAAPAGVIRPSRPVSCVFRLGFGGRMPLRKVFCDPNCYRVEPLSSLEPFRILILLRRRLRACLLSGSPVASSRSGDLREARIMREILAAMAFSIGG